METLVITGAGKGIGLATTRMFLEKGCVVYACSRNIDALIALEAVYPVQCKPIRVDLESDSSLQNFRQRLDQDNAAINYVIHNAGFIVNKPFTRISAEELQRSYRVNVMAPYLLTQVVLPYLSPRAHVIAISSMGGFQGSVKFPGLTAYSSSKAAVSSLMECLQAEYADKDFAFNSLCIGAVQTQMLQEAFPGYKAPLQPEQMAMYIYQFVTTASDFIRGKTIPVSLSTP